MEQGHQEKGSTRTVCPRPHNQDAITLLNLGMLFYTYIYIYIYILLAALCLKFKCNPVWEWDWYHWY